MLETHTIPLFPLDLVLYPHEQLPLHIFEDRYQEMIAYCLKQEQPFGVIWISEGKIAEMGCTAHIEEVVSTYEDGRMDIVVQGQRKFNVGQVHDKHAYITADVQYVVDSKEPLRVDLRERVITQHMRLLELAGRKVRPNSYQEVDEISYFIAHNSGLQLPQKQKVLEMKSENERFQFLAKHLEALIPRVEEFEDVRKKVKSNGHFKDYPSPDMDS